MTRYGRMLLTFLMVAFTATPALAQSGLYCAHNGFDVNAGVTTKSFRCGVATLVRGSSPITTSSGSGTATSSGAFTFAASDATAGSDNTTFSITGLTIHDQANRQRYFYRVSAKASNSSITIQEGNANPTITGTWSDWSYWRSTCYRAAVNSSGADAAAIQFNDVQWGLLGTAAIQTSQLFVWGLAQPGTTVGIANAPWFRYTATRGYGDLYGSSGTLLATPGFQLTYPISVTNTKATGLGAQHLVSATTSTAAAYPVFCIIRAPITTEAR